MSLCSMHSISAHIQRDVYCVKSMTVQFFGAKNTELKYGADSVLLVFSVNTTIKIIEQNNMSIVLLCIILDINKDKGYTYK